MPESDGGLQVSWPGRPLCGHGPARLVRWSDGKFVKWECEQCGESRTLSESDFGCLTHVQICSGCGGTMVGARLAYSNYGYRCENCGLSVALADLLPLARRMDGEGA